MKGPDDEGKRHTEEQVIAILKEHEAGMTTADPCRKSRRVAPLRPRHAHLVARLM